MFQKLKVQKEEWPTFQFNSHERVCPYTTTQPNDHVSPLQLHPSQPLALVSLSFISFSSFYIIAYFILKFVCSVVVVGKAELDGTENKPRLLSLNRIKGVACGILAAYAVTSASFPVTAATQVQIHPKILTLTHH